MRVYLASQWARRDEMRLHRETLKNRGHVCTSGWLDEPDGMPPDQAAIADMHAILTSDAMIAFTEEKSVGYTTGGRHVELGFALGSNIPICIVGPRENVFCHLRQVLQADCVVEALQALGEPL